MDEEWFSGLLMGYSWSTSLLDVQRAIAIFSGEDAGNMPITLWLPSISWDFQVEIVH